MLAFYIFDSLFFAQVEGDGRLVPATDDEVMEVEDFLLDDMTEIQVVTDTVNTAECISNDVSSSGMFPLGSS